MNVLFKKNIISYCRRPTLPIQNTRIKHRRARAHRMCKTHREKQLGLQAHCLSKIRSEKIRVARERPVYLKSMPTKLPSSRAHCLSKIHAKKQPSSRARCPSKIRSEKNRAARSYPVFFCMDFG